MKFLVREANADVTLTNNMGETALEIASQQGNSEIVDILRQGHVSVSKSPSLYRAKIKVRQVRKVKKRKF